MNSCTGTPAFPSVDPNQIADYIINFSHSYGDYITNLKLQKLVYYVQAWHIALYNRSLFEEDFQAWVHGPVLPSLYNRFRQYSWNPIPENPPVPQLPDGVAEHIVEVMKSYFRYSAYDLERISHQEPPWQVARGGLPIDVPSTNPIAKEHMQSYYNSLVSR